MNEDCLLGSQQHVSICDIITRLHLVVWSYVLKKGRKRLKKMFRPALGCCTRKLVEIHNTLCSVVSRPIYQNLTRNRKNWSPQINLSQINPTNSKKSIGGIQTRTLAFKFKLPVRRSTSVLSHHMVLLSGLNPSFSYICIMT